MLYLNLDGFIKTLDFFLMFQLIVFSFIFKFFYCYLHGDSASIKSGRSKDKEKRY